jgi:NAD(P)H-dependent flavin oxidoreductase YrpB (nitropropane dioxygenase family)
VFADVRFPLILNTKVMLLLLYSLMYYLSWYLLSADVLFQLISSAKEMLIAKAISSTKARLYEDVGDNGVTEVYHPD